MDLRSTSGLTRIRTLVAVVAAAAALLAVENVVQFGELPAMGPPSAVTDPDMPAGTPEAPTGTATSEGLTPGTRRAYAAAASAIRADGIEVSLTSGYRSVAEQEQLYQHAIDKYGSPEAARVWVLPPDESRHVRGVALDVAPRQAARWLDRHGARFGLCRTMEWEWWHFEYDAAWQRGGSCPPAQQRP